MLRHAFIRSTACHRNSLLCHYPFFRSTLRTCAIAFERIASARRGYVLSFAIAVRPVFLRHFHQVDEDILLSQLQLFVQAACNGFVETLLQLDTAPTIQRDLQKDAVIGSFDA